MAEVDLTPSTRVISKANQILTTTDSLDRVIKYRRLKPSDQMDLVTILGADRSLNPIALNMASAAYRVTEIDGEIIFPAETYDELKEIMDQLENEGLNQMYRVDMAPSKKKDEEPVVEEVKIEKKSKAG